jgi:hypothetical protein
LSEEGIYWISKDMYSRPLNDVRLRRMNKSKIPKIMSNKFQGQKNHTGIFSQIFNWQLRFLKFRGRRTINETL